MKNILLIVDMQKGFARYEQTLALNEKILELLKLQVFDSVIATRFLNDNNSIYEQLLYLISIYTIALMIALFRNYAN